MKDTNLEHKLYTTKEVAEALGLSEETLKVWRHAGKTDLPYIKIGRAVRYRYSDVTAFIEARYPERFK